MKAIEDTLDELIAYEIYHPIWGLIRNSFRNNEKIHIHNSLWSEFEVHYTVRYSLGER